jgi:histone-lysine N-methyltransferase SETMAR
MTRSDFHYFKVLTIHYWKRGYTPEKCYTVFKEVEGDVIPEPSTVDLWFKEIRDTGTLFHEPTSLGRPRISELASQILTYLNQFPNLSTKQLAGLTFRNHATVKDRLVNELGFVKIATKWVPHRLTASQKAAWVVGATALKALLVEEQKTGFLHLVTGDESWLPLGYPPCPRWVLRGTPRPTAVKKNIVDEKVLLTVFFSGARFWVVHYLMDGLTMDTDTFINTLLKPLNEEFATCRSPRDPSIQLHMDNAPCHRSSRTTAELEAMNVHPVPHPPYSPDLSPSDFFLFGHLKGHLRGFMFPNSDTLMDEVSDFLTRISPTTLHRVFLNWILRCDEVLRTGGEYIAKRRLQVTV